MLLRFYLLEEYIRLRMGLARNGVKGIDRLRNKIPRVAPCSVDAPIGCSNTLVLTQCVADCDLAVEVGRTKARGIGQWDVRGREIERRAAHTNRTVDREAAAAVVRIGHVEIDAPIAMLRIVRDVDIIRVLIDRERWQYMLYVRGYNRIHDLGSRPGVSAIVGTYEQNVRVPGRVAKDQAGRVAPREIQFSIARSHGRLQSHSGSVDIPGVAELARTRIC